MCTDHVSGVCGIRKERNRQSEHTECADDMLSIYEIRDGQGADIADIAVLEAHTFSDPWTENGIRETICQNNTTVLGARKNDIMAGYVIMYYVLDEGEVARIAADASCRRQGVAGRLLEKLEEICEKKRITRLMLEVRRSNTAAISFYRKYGFKDDGVRKNYYTRPCEDAVLMSKELVCKSCCEELDVPENGWQA